MTFVSLAMIAMGHHLIPAATAPVCLKDFDNGQAVQNPFVPGDFYPRLTLHNLQDAPAIVKLTKAGSDTVHIYFIAPQSTATIDEVSPGMYTLSFAVEPELAGDCTTLRKATEILRFDTQFDLYRIVTQRADGSLYVEAGDNWANLHNSDEGTASSTRLTVSQFNR